MTIRSVLRNFIRLYKSPDMDSRVITSNFGDSEHIKVVMRRDPLLFLAAAFSAMCLNISTSFA